MKAAEERSRLLIHYARGWRKEGLVSDGAFEQIVAANPLESRANGFLVQLVFFILTVNAMGAMWGFFSVLQLPAGLLTGVASLALAELLIRQARLSATGVEAALWSGGLIALITALPNSGAKEAILLIAAAIGVAGARVRNPVLGGVAVVVALFYFEEKFDLGTVAAIVVGVIATAMLLRTWQRFSTEVLWSLLTVAMPITAAGFGDWEWREFTIPVLVVWALIHLLLAVRHRHHALFLGGVAAALAGGVLLSLELRWPEELELFLAGAALLATSWGVAHLLRGRTTGLVTTREVQREEGLLETVGAGVSAGITAADAPIEPEGRGEGDGGFGGAGATGQY